MVAPKGLWVMNADGSGKKQLVTASGIQDARFSPDGKRIAFDKVIDTWNTDIFVIPVTGGTPTRVTTSPYRERQPRWSPDGKKLTFVSDRVWESNAWDDVFMINSTAPYGKAVNVTNSASNGPCSSDYSTEMSFTWSPDGKQFAVMCMYETHEDYEYFFAFFDLVTRSWHDYGSHALNPRDYSPDGKRLALTDNWSKLSVLTVPAGRRLVFADRAMYGHAAWSPDGTLLTVGRRNLTTGKFDTYILRPDGTGQRLLAAGYDPVDWTNR